MSPSKNSNLGLAADPRDSHDLLGRTLRTTAILVGACVLFVGGLSTAAVVIANKAVPSTAAEDKAATPSAAETADTKSAAPKKPLPTRPHADVGSVPSSPHAPVGSQSI